MLIEFVLRFIIGGIVVSAFAVIGDILRPKTFAGIFGAAPSVAVATLGLTFFLKGGAYSSTEGRSMIVGAVAFIVYSLATGLVLIRWQPSSLLTAGSAWVVWVGVAFGLWGVFLR